MLKKEEWRWDVMPEIYEGSNVMDFIDPEVLQKLKELEVEEEVLQEAHEPFDYESYREEHRI